VEVRMTR